MIGDGAVDVRLLERNCLRCAARRQPIPPVGLRVNDGRKEFVSTRQPFGAIFAVLPQRLAQHELAAISQIAGVQPVEKAPRFQAHHAGDHSPSSAGVNTGDQEVGIGHVLPATNEMRHGLPVEAPEHVQPVDQDHSLVQSHF